MLKTEFLEEKQKNWHVKTLKVNRKLPLIFDFGYIPTNKDSKLYENLQEINLKILLKNI